MKVVIDIPNEMYDWLDNGFPDEDDAERLWQVVKKGTPLEEHCNNCDTGNPCLYCKHSFEERGEQDADSN